MSFGSWLKSKLKKKPTASEFIPTSLSVSKIETPEKIVETRIRPIKIPSIIDIGERLGFISRDLSELKREMVSKSWFKTEYEDSGTLIIDKLNEIQSSLNQLNNFTKDLINNLSNLRITKLKLTKPTTYDEFLDTSEKIYKIIEDEGKIRYKDIVARLHFTDPTICKHLKSLLNTNRIKKTKVGKASFYETIKS